MIDCWKMRPSLLVCTYAFFLLCLSGVQAFSGLSGLHSLRHTPAGLVESQRHHHKRAMSSAAMHRPAQSQRQIGALRASPVTGNRCAASKTMHMCECVIVEQATDAETGNEYYRNSMTGETAWTLPTPVQNPAAISAASAVSTTVCVRHDAFMCVTRRCLLSTL